MKHLLLILFTFVGFSLFGQFNDEKYSIDLLKIKYRDNYRTGRKLTEGLSNILSEDYNLIRNSNIRLAAVINTGKSHLIEGMDIQVIGKPELKFKIKDIVTKNEKSYIYSKDLKAGTSKLLGDALVNSFLNDDKAKDKFRLFIKDFIDLQFASGCEKQFEKIEKLVSKNDFRNAIRQTIFLMPSSCKNEAETMQKELFKKQAIYYCEKKIQKAEIMINSGVSFQLKRAVNILLSISPEAPCASEALELSKRIGEKMSEVNQNSVSIKKYSDLYNGNRNSWKSFYIESLMTK